MSTTMAGSSTDTEMPDFMVGSCLTMCPSAEVRLRQSEGLLHPLERSVNASGERMNYGNPRLMVKEFSRSAAGHEIKSSDIRPLPVLAKTVKFLLTNSCCRTDVSWALIYQFVGDRLRAVRQDLCVQGVKNIDCIKLHLASARFHVYSHYRMCEHELADFDPYLNKKMLLETLTLILALYRDLDKEADSSDVRHEHSEQQSEHEDIWNEEEGEESEKKIMEDAQTNEKDFHEEAVAAGLDTKLEDMHILEDGEEGIESQPFDHEPTSQPDSSNEDSRSKKVFENIETYSSREEAEAFYIIVNFGSEEALSHALTLPKSIRCSPLVSLVTEMSTSWLTHNFSRVIYLSRFLPPLFLCAFHPHITEIERKALSIMSRSHSCRGQVYNKDDLAKMLFFSDPLNMRKACNHYGIDVTELGVVFSKGTFKADAPQRKVTKLDWIEERLNKVPLSELLIPQDLQDADFSLLPVEFEDEEEHPHVTPSEALLAQGYTGSTFGEAQDKGDAPLDPVREGHDRHDPNQREGVTSDFTRQAEVSALDQDSVEKSLQQDQDQESVDTIEKVEKCCSSPDISVHSFIKPPLSKDSHTNEKETFNVNEAIIKDRIVTSSPCKGHLNTANISQDSGVSNSSMSQTLSDLVMCEDSSIMSSECSRDLDESNDMQALDPVDCISEATHCLCSSLKETKSSPQKPSESSTLIEGIDTSGNYSPEVNTAELRRRKRQEEKKAIAQKVREMKEKQIANENWVKKKNLVCRPLVLTVGIMSASACVGFLVYQYFNQ